MDGENYDADRFLNGNHQKVICNSTYELRDRGGGSL